MNFSKRIWCKDIVNYENQEVVLCGWIKKIRKLGNLIFIDLRDRTGISQLVLNKDHNFFATNELTRETTIYVVGNVVIRSNPNLQIATGKYEVDVKEIKIFTKALTPPLIIENTTDALEDVRLKYRYLDLRRPVMYSMLETRFKFILEIRNFLNDNGFIEIETPILTKTTPEGARDYIVPTRLGPNMFYALPQSPQIYKQLLMLSGVERYFQIAKCFRDEDSRSDRQPEHTQIDIEMSFVNEIDIQEKIELMLKNVLLKIFNINITTPFPRIKYFNAMEKYGTDKPDLRYEMFLIPASRYFEKLNVKFIKNILNKNGCVKAIVVNDYIITNSDKKMIDKLSRDNFISTSFWIKFEKNAYESSVKEFSVENMKNICQQLGIQNSDDKKYTVVFNAGLDVMQVNKSLGSIRNYFGEICNLKNSNLFKFAWIVDWPLYEIEKVVNELSSTKDKIVYDEVFVSAHNPFSKPTDETIEFLDIDKQKARAQSYDLVLNGYELGSGAIRNNDPDLQARAFKALNLSDKEINAKFGFLLDAYKYGAPPHGGMGIGLERLLMILLNKNSIKEVIAFPKNNSGIDPLTSSPSETDKDSLDKVYICIKDKD